MTRTDIRIEPTAAPSPPTRPPAASLRPAVAIPFSVLATLLVASSWARTVLAAPKTPPSGGSDSVPFLSAPIVLPAGTAEPVAAWGRQVHRWADSYGVPDDLVIVVMTLESCGDPSAVSRAGALGLFQVMPFHFQPGEDPLDPEVNARRGLEYLRASLQIAGGDAALALAGYNGGHGLITRDPSSWPSETVRYVQWGTAMLEDIRAGRSPSPAFQAWLAAGGASLCRRASERASTSS